jgi:GT2 family glycosyltransferase
MPGYSVVVATHARPWQLAACLESLTRLDGPGGGFEVIVVDDGGPAPLDRVVEPFRARLDLRVMRQANRGPAAARNAGARAARGYRLAFTDDDCAPSREWLRELDRALAVEPRCLVGGTIGNGLPANPFSSATQTITTAVYRYYDAHPECERLVSASNMAATADDFRQVGGFSESFPLAAGEDYDLCRRWHRSGRPVRYVPGAAVSHAHALTFATFCRQHFNYGRGLCRFHTGVAARGERSILRSRPGFRRHLLAFPLRHERSWRRWAAAALVALAQAATLAGACYESGGRRPGPASAASPSRRTSA